MIPCHAHHHPVVHDARLALLLDESCASSDVLSMVSQGTGHCRQSSASALQGKGIDALAAHPGTAKTAIWDKMDKEKVEGVAFDLTAKVLF